jgi:hypothetical protein
VEMVATKGFGKGRVGAEYCAGLGAFLVFG